MLLIKGQFTISGKPNAGMTWHETLMKAFLSMLPSDVAPGHTELFIHCESDTRVFLASQNPRSEEMEIQRIVFSSLAARVGGREALIATVLPLNSILFVHSTPEFKHAYCAQGLADGLFSRPRRIPFADDRLIGCFE